MLRTAHKRFRKKPEKAYSKFVVENKDWIYDYALFMSLKFANKGKAWYEWDEPLKMYKPKAIKMLGKNMQMISTSGALCSINISSSGKS